MDNTALEPAAPRHLPPAPSQSAPALPECGNRIADGWSTLARIAVCLCLAQGPQPAGAEDSERRKELDQVRERIETTRKSRDELEARKNELDTQLEETERTYGRVVKTIRDLETENRIHGERLAELRRQQGILAAAMQRQHRALAGQARAAYAAGSQDWLKLLLNQEDPSRLTHVLAYYRYLSQARASLLQGMENELATARHLQDELSAETERLTQTRQTLIGEQATLAETRRVRRGLLAELEHDLRDKDSELDRLQDDEQRLQDVLTALQTSGDGETPTGTPSATNPPPPISEVRSSCPVTGRVVGQFGGPRLNGRWDGLLIAADEGTPVRAVANGRVAYSDWLRGYGLLTIVDHGDGVMSLYAFNQSLYKTVGESIAAGDIIAAVGASGGRSEPGLYFGIREHGKPVNPLPWCGHTD